MGAAYFFVLDREIAGCDPFVDGKAMARESDRIALITQSVGLRDFNDFVSANPDDLMATAEELGIELPEEATAEAWFAPEEGLSWISQLQTHLSANPSAVEDADAVFADLTEYRALLDTAQANGARSHLTVDF